MIRKSLKYLRIIVCFKRYAQIYRKIKENSYISLFNVIIIISSFVDRYYNQFWYS